MNFVSPTWQLKTHQWSLSFFFENFDLIIIFEPSNFQVIMGGVIVLIVSIILLFIMGIIESRQAKEKRLFMEKIMPEIASKFGKAISASESALRFERNETIFDAQIKS